MRHLEASRVWVDRRFLLELVSDIACLRSGVKMQMVSVKALNMSRVVLRPDATATQDTDPGLVIFEEREEFHSYNSVCMDEDRSIRQG
jgi:hypothetical protein